MTGRLSFESRSGGIPPLEGLDGVDQWEALLYDLPSPRREVLLNINEKTRTAAVRYQNYKLIIAASSTDRIKFYLSVRVALSLSEPLTFKSPTLTSRIPSLRWEASLQCTPDSPGSSCDPTVSKGGCVYDVERDPCETNDLAVDHPDLASSLRALLVRHRRTLVPQGNLPTDSFNADPAKWGGAWTTWGSGE
uniref:Uncharacterized protein n=1 Tax=Timema poppense TaxID=170557 RepID=A0A7R9DHB4_TIMPO|nr:unnamed protein product [Timema poppensis]